MKTWNEVTHFAGFDWAKDHHDVLVLDGTGKITSEFRFDHTATGWKLCEEKLKQFPELAIAVEASIAPPLNDWWRWAKVDDYARHD